MRALILVDVQNDFVPGGALAVPRGDEVAAVANRLMDRFDLVVATQDWHPADHGSFASRHEGRKPGEVVELAGLRQVLWPDHCVQGTGGAELVSDLDVARIDKVIRKGTDASVDSYSGFFDNARRKATGLADFLNERGADALYVMGLATDYCVKFTALDACDLGFRTYLVVDGCRGIDLEPGDIDRAVEEMKQAGAGVVQSSRIGRDQSRHAAGGAPRV